MFSGPNITGEISFLFGARACDLPWRFQVSAADVDAAVAAVGTTMTISVGSRDFAGAPSIVELIVSPGACVAYSVHPRAKRAVYGVGI